MTKVLIGIKPCGCAVAATLAEEEAGGHTDHVLSDWKKRGIRASETTAEEACHIVRKCNHDHR